MINKKNIFIFFLVLFIILNILFSSVKYNFLDNITLNFYFFFNNLKVCVVLLEDET